MCPVRILVRVISRCREDWFDEFQGRGEFLSRTKIDLNLFMGRTKSELLVWRYVDVTVGRSKAFLVALSTFSLLGMSECPGA